MKQPGQRAGRRQRADRALAGPADVDPDVHRGGAERHDDGLLNRAEVGALPRLVATAQLPQATAQNQVGFAGAVVVGLALGSCLFQSVGRAWPFVADALSYLTSAALARRERGQIARLALAPPDAQRRGLHALLAHQRADLAESSATVGGCEPGAPQFGGIAQDQELNGDSIAAGPPQGGPSSLCQRRACAG